jgi:glutamine synthetase
MSVVEGRVPTYTDEELSELQDRLRAAGVEYVMASYVDGHGVVKCKTVPIGHFHQMMRGSELFTGAALDLLGQSPADDELAVFPDAEAIVQLPWRPDVAFAPGNLYLRGEPYPMDPRTVLSRQTERARDLGYVFNLGMETEFFFVRVAEDGRPEPWNPRDTLDKPCYDAVGMLESMHFLDEMVGYLNAMGWDVHSFDHEDGNGQYEFDFSYTDALAMADRFALFRLMAKEVARRHDTRPASCPSRGPRRRAEGRTSTCRSPRPIPGTTSSRRRATTSTRPGYQSWATGSSPGSSGTRPRSSRSPARP